MAAVQVKGVNTTKVDAGPSGDNVISQGYVNAKVEVWTDEYELVAVEAGSTVDIAELPANAKVLKIEMYTDALGASGTVDIGDADDTDRYSAAPFDTSTAGKFESDTLAGHQYVIGTSANDSRVQLLTAGATISGTVRTCIYFTR